MPWAPGPLAAKHATRADIRSNSAPPWNAICAPSSSYGSKQVLKCLAKSTSCACYMLLHVVYISLSRCISMYVFGDLHNMSHQSTCAIHRRSEACFLSCHHTLRFHPHKLCVWASVHLLQSALDGSHRKVWTQIGIISPFLEIINIQISSWITIYILYMLK